MYKKRLSVDEILNYISFCKPKYLGINVFSQNINIVKRIIESIDINCECFIGGQVVKCIYKDILLWNLSNPLNIIIGDGEYMEPIVGD